MVDVGENQNVLQKDVHMYNFFVEELLGVDVETFGWGALTVSRTTLKKGL